MNDDFVSSDLAKKLKEKGFRYNKNNLLDRLCMENQINHPTISQVLKWLREEHVFHVEIMREKYNGWMYFIQLLDASYVMNHNGFDCYESAALAGITYCLDNLI